MEVFLTETYKSRVIIVLFIGYLPSPIIVQKEIKAIVTEPFRMIDDVS